jgi:hypothetical protein
MRRDSAAPGGARPPDDIAPPVEIAIDGRAALSSNEPQHGNARLSDA